MTRVVRRDDPALDPAIDLVLHARAVLRGAVTLDPDARLEMIRNVGLKPSPSASDVAVARNFLAARGERP